MKVRTINKESLPLNAELRVVGARCLLSTNSQEVLSSLARWKAPARGADEPSFELRVLMDPVAKRERDRVPHFRGLHHLVFAVFGADETIVFDLARRRVSAVVSDETARDAVFWNTRFLPTALGLLGATIGVVPLHCACLDRGGEALLLAGVSGAGKSTLAVALSRLGFSVISDGWTYVGKDGDQMTAHGISAPVKLLPDAVEHFPELRGFKAGVASNGELAFEVDVAGAFHATVLQQSTPRWVMFLERVASQGCEIVPYDNDAAQAFLQNTLERLPVQLQEATDTRAALVASLAAKECWLARYGGPPQAAAETIARFCERA